MGYRGSMRNDPVFRAPAGQRRRAINDILNAWAIAEIAHDGSDGEDLNLVAPSHDLDFNAGSPHRRGWYDGDSYAQSYPAT